MTPKKRGNNTKNWALCFCINWLYCLSIPEKIRSSELPYRIKCFLKTASREQMMHVYKSIN